jgi:hypothetical protein
LTGSRQVSQLAVQTAKQLESGNMNAAQIRDALGREVTESAVLRALHELWKQLRIIPVVPEVGTPALWQPLRQRFQKAIAEGASTSQVTAISVLASIYLQAVIAASMEDVEMFLSPLTSRSKIREVVRGLAATRQVHTTTMGHSPMFYVAGTLPEFPAVPSFQISNSLPSYRNSAYLASYLGHAQDYDEDLHDAPHGNGNGVSAARAVVEAAAASVAQNHRAEPSGSAKVTKNAEESSEELISESFSAAIAEPRIRPAAAHSGKPHASVKPQAPGKSASPRPRPARTAGAAHPRERSRTAIGSGEARTGASGDRRRAPMPRTAASGSSSRGAASPSRPVRPASFSGNGNGSHPAKPAHTVSAKTGATNGHTHSPNGSNGHSNGRNGNQSAAGANSRAGSAYKSGSSSAARNGSGARSESRNAGAAARPTSGRGASGQRPSTDGASRKPAASAAKRYSFSGQAKQAPKSPSKTAASSAVKSHSKSAHPAESKRRG